MFVGCWVAEFRKEVVGQERLLAYGMGVLDIAFSVLHMRERVLQGESW